MPRIMGLDYGDRRTGVAVSDLFGWTAQGVEVIEHKTEEACLRRVEALVRENEVEEVVVGLPKNMNGTVGPRGEICMAFAEALRQKLSMPVHLWDERLTTVAAERTLLEADVSRSKRKQVIDKMAAAILLQSYLDSRGR
ncbi:Holliday junction resolvase RuvX [Cohnella sp. REN36]|uniref:Holliday junction resolvase RuvX n=1 Tax=Cohnella sp. REN36 TaxID=2887347 RepID=UPI001D1490A7|nr:Holliday junction resolvase RuvX [Cohnella sp. REN36]MCC3375615.1 Holliday junction resolvase RuvX [Cohnella sp. REN36]